MFSSTHRVVEEPNHVYEDAERSRAENSESAAVGDGSGYAPACIRIYDVSRSLQPVRETRAVTGEHREFVLLPTDECHAGTEIYETVPNVNIEQILSAVGRQEVFQAHVPNVNIVSSAADGYERAQVYERVPDVDLTQILDVNIALMLSTAAGLYERAQTYERVPNVNIAQILAIAGGYEIAQVYERVPNVNLLQVLLAAQIYEQVPNVDIAQIISQVTSNRSRNSLCSESISQCRRGECDQHNGNTGSQSLHASKTM